ncbi:MAG TPA: 5'/3'-nucleotidase SurE, partial [bacterium]|nr:5'/3'-nucleotidase SurE [bacterium]
MGVARGVFVGLASFFVSHPRLRILLTNDDGFDAPGLRALIGAFQGLGDLAVAAPDEQASASGHSISLHKPIKAKADPGLGVSPAFRISSTPA